MISRWRSSSALKGRVAWCLMPGNYWLGFGHTVVGIRDHRSIPPLFSERYGHGPTKHAHVGPWCLSFNPNWKGRRNRPT